MDKVFLVLCLSSLACANFQHDNKGGQLNLLNRPLIQRPVQFGSDSNSDLIVGEYAGPMFAASFTSQNLPSLKSSALSDTHQNQLGFSTSSAQLSNTQSHVDSYGELRPISTSSFDVDSASTNFKLLGNGNRRLLDGGLPIQLAVQSEYSVGVVDSVTSRAFPKPITIEIGPHQSTPLQVNFKTQSSTLNVKQEHKPSKGSYKETRSEEEPHRLVHLVHRPIYQDVHEIIQPIRKITQQIKPVKEQIETIVAKSSAIRNALSSPTGLVQPSGALTNYSHSPQTPPHEFEHSFNKPSVSLSANNQQALTLTHSKAPSAGSIRTNQRPFLNRTFGAVRPTYGGNRSSFARNENARQNLQYLTQNGLTLGNSEKINEVTVKPQITQVDLDSILKFRNVNDNVRFKATPTIGQIRTSFASS